MPSGATFTTESSPRLSDVGCDVSKSSSSVTGTIHNSPVPAAWMTTRSPARKTWASSGGSAVDSPRVDSAGSTIRTVASAWSTTRTVVPCCTTSRSVPEVRRTELSSSTSGLARPTAWRAPFATHTEPSPRSSFCAVYPVDVSATPATMAATTVPLVAVATPERCAATQDRRLIVQSSETSTHFSALWPPVLPCRLTVTAMQTVSPGAASTTNRGCDWVAVRTPPTAIS